MDENTWKSITEFMRKLQEQTELEVKELDKRFGDSPSNLYRDLAEGRLSLASLTARRDKVESTEENMRQAREWLKDPPNYLNYRVSRAKYVREKRIWRKLVAKYNSQAEEYIERGMNVRCIEIAV